MTPSPHPLTSCPWPLNPATSHNNNKNNDGLHACVRTAEDIEPFLQLTCLVVECESQQQFVLSNGPHKRFWFLCTSHFHLFLVVFGFSVYCLFVYSGQAYCASSVSSCPFLVNVKRHLEACNMNYSVFGRFQWIHVDANILETMQRKTDGPWVSESLGPLVGPWLKWPSYGLEARWAQVWMVVKLSGEKTPHCIVCGL